METQGQPCRRRNRSGVLAMSLQSRIEELRDEVPEERNAIRSYLPYRKGGKGFNYDIVAGNIVARLLCRRAKRSLTLEKFRQKCLDRLDRKLSRETIIPHIDKMYFDDGDVASISPEFMLLLKDEQGSSSTKHLSKVLMSFLSNHQGGIRFDSTLNFIERVFFEVLQDYLEEDSYEQDEQCYLPFIQGLFLRDILFLSLHPDYFLEQIASCMELYCFIYCAQLGLNIHHWRKGEEPVSRPLFFILDTEKASKERRQLQEHGYHCLYQYMEDVFPILTMLEYFNTEAVDTKRPLWSIARQIATCSSEEQVNILNSLYSFSERFCVDRAIQMVHEKPKSAIEALEHLFLYATRQFAQGTGRNRVKAQYMEVFEKEVAGSFLQNRGRAGKVLTVNQDLILLLTNLAIGDKGELRFQELLCEFCSRGFFFDKSSQQALINFYERVGNVNRMSDSGDAVYVRSTI